MGIGRQLQVSLLGLQSMELITSPLQRRPTIGEGPGVGDFAFEPDHGGSGSINSRVEALQLLEKIDFTHGSPL